MTILHRSFSRIALGSAALALALSAPMATPARADGDAIVGGIIGGIIGGAIASESQKKRSSGSKRSSAPAKKPGLSSAQREANREVQSALNTFGFPVGTPDGSLGPKSRAAISQYQVVMGYPATGQLTEVERMILVGAWQKAQIGGPGVAQIVSSHPQGMRGLLVAERDMMAGGTMALAPLAPMPAAPPVPVAVPVPVPVAEPAAPAAPAAPALPVFNIAAPAAPQVSMAGHCANVSMVTSSAGGFVTEASLGDPLQALGEQFCLARGYAINAGQELAGQVVGATPAQIEAQCQGLMPALAAQVSALGQQDAAGVMQGVTGFVTASGQTAEALQAMGKICLSVGYRTDNAEMALDSALLLAGTGQTPYAELLGHHLAMGFGVAARDDLAGQWYQVALGAMERGTAPVFAPGQPERNGLIAKAALVMAGGSAAVETPQPVVQPAQGFSLPSFSLPKLPGINAAQP